MSIRKLIEVLTTKPQTRRQAIRRRKLLIALLMRLVVLVVLILLLVLIITGIKSCSRRSAEKKAAEELKAKQEAMQGDVKIGFTGCMLLHSTILNSYLNSEGIYDFTEPFKYVEKYYSEPDIMCCEMEGSIAEDTIHVSGYPLFAYPDTFPGNLQSVGFDLQFLATNHVYDGKSKGLAKTLSTYKDEKIDFTGIRKKDDDKRYKIMKKNGVKIGFVDYTYGSPESFNALTVSDKDAKLINMFKEGSPDGFYSEVERQIKEMKKEGADFIVYAIHWGAEYELEPSDDQKAIAQELCNLGVDAIIGGHPHVEQPIEVLTSENGKHKMFCIYSIGNAFSNQTKGVVMDTAHCEDGVILTMDLHKDSKGKVTITDMEMIPTWVCRQVRERKSDEDEDEEKKENEQEASLTADNEETEEEEEEQVTDELYDYHVLPLNNIKGLEKKTGIKGISKDCKASYKRTMEILGDGFKKAKKELVTAKKTKESKDSKK